MSTRTVHTLRIFFGLVFFVATAHARADDLIVSAAASLSDAFGDIARRFEANHPGNHVVLNFAASDVLLKQITQGAPADVFASADEVTMDRAAAGDAIDSATRTDFAGNTLVLIVSNGTGSPSALQELNAPSFVHIAIGNPESVPAGRYAREALTTAQLWGPLQARLVQAANVRQALEYVARGEAQAGFVYATDAAAQNDKVHVAMSVPTSTPVRYPIATVKDSKHAQLAREFVAYVCMPEAQAILASAGFSAPNQ